MARVISVTLPFWPIDRLRRSAPEAAASSEERPLVLAGRVGNRRLVTAACAVAQDLGLSVGMPVSKAQAMVPDLQVLPHDPKPMPRRWNGWHSGCCSGSRRSWRSIRPTGW